MNVKTVLHGIVERIDDDLFKNEDNRVMHKTEEFIDLYRNAHGEFMPDDIIYEHIYSIITEIEMYLWYKEDECDDIDDLIDELMDEITIEPDYYTDNLLSWLSSNLNRYAIAEELYQDGYTDKHSYDEVEELIKQYIREIIPEDEIRSKYYWGDGEPIVMFEE